MYRRVALLLGCVLVAGALQIAWAHAILVASTPKVNASVKGPTLAVLLRFNVRIDNRRSRLRLIIPGGSEIGLAVAQQSTPDTLASVATGLNPGGYRLVWQVLASDGHMSQGEVPFTVN